jgi:hypothetical protein
VAGETDLPALIRSMQPALHDDEFVFCSVAAAPEGIDAIARFREREGVTLVCRRAEAERSGLTQAFPCRLITLNVHSSLEAVGFLAAITTELARHGIGVNVVSAFYHDHLFIASDQAERAIAILRAQASASTGVTGSSSAQQTTPNK